MRHPRSPRLSLRAVGTAGTARIAAALAALARPGDWLALDGELGAGKTAFVAAYCEALGVPPGEVDSPTFVLLNEYRGRLPVFHFDAYRLSGSEAELDEIGFFDERLAEGVVILEWAERLAPWLPARALGLRLEILGESERRIEIANADEPCRLALAALASDGRER